MTTRSLLISGNPFPVPHLGLIFDNRAGIGDFEAARLGGLIS